MKTWIQNALAKVKRHAKGSVAVALLGAVVSFFSPWIGGVLVGVGVTLTVMKDEVVE